MDVVRQFVEHERVRHPHSVAPAAQRTTAPNQLSALQASAGNAAVTALLTAHQPTIQRKEVTNDGELTGAKDWTTRDREGNTERWKAACLTNLKAVDSSQYVKVVERRDFYKWFYEHTAALGYTTRWALAARLVANGAHEIADMDVEHRLANLQLNMANVELQGVMREGNQVIFDNVLPKLKALLDRGPVTGAEALQWDMKTLAEEQALVQPLYDRMDPQTFDQLDYIARKKRFARVGVWISDADEVAAGAANRAGTVPAFNSGDLSKAEDRWKYGMELGNQFAPTATGYRPGKDTMPVPGKGYSDGSELAKVDTRAHLHELDAWLNPNRWRHDPDDAGENVDAIIDKLTPFEKSMIVKDKSADGWSYSNRFGWLLSIPESTVRKAIPSGPASAAADIAKFMINWRMAHWSAEKAAKERKSEDLYD